MIFLWLSLIAICLLLNLAAGGATDNNSGVSFCTAVFLIILTLLISWEKQTQDCESKLPRNEQCTLIAIPESQIKQEETK